MSWWGFRRKQVLVVPEKLQPCDGESELGGVDDMTKLTYLNEPSVLDNLQRRYGLNEIYVSGLKFESTLYMSRISITHCSRIGSLGSYLTACCLFLCLALHLLWNLLVKKLKIN